MIAVLHIMLSLISFILSYLFTFNKLRFTIRKAVKFFYVISLISLIIVNFLLNFTISTKSLQKTKSCIKLRILLDSYKFINPIALTGIIIGFISCIQNNLDINENAVETNFQEIPMQFENDSQDFDASFSEGKMTKQIRLGTLKKN